MKKEFSELGYRAQIKLLTEVAHEALKDYSIRDYKLKFINHGENTTFKVTSGQKNYLLRVHRDNYHSDNSILEELKWVEYINQSGEIDLQKPILNNKGNLITKISVKGRNQVRQVDILTWKEGMFPRKSPENHYFEIGLLIGQLHGKSLPVKHRMYWTIDGLLGKNATMGSLDDLKEVYPKEYSIIEPYRKLAIKKLRAYQKKNPTKFSLIHADLHFGNMVWHKNIPSPIDFDDCGYGPHMYDLAIVLHASRRSFERLGPVEARLRREALFNGYSIHRPLTKDDIDILLYLILTREIVMTGWLYARRDNPSLREYMKIKMKNIDKDVRAYENYLD